MAVVVMAIVIAVIVGTTRANERIQRQGPCWDAYIASHDATWSSFGAHTNGDG